MSTQRFDGRERSRARMLFGMMLIISALVASCRSREQTSTKLPSGRTIRILAWGHFEVPNQEPVLRLRYETDTPLSDTASLRKEAIELWPVLRARAEDGSYVYAAFAAEAPPSGLCIRREGLCRVESHGFVVTKRADDRWYFASDSAPLPDVTY